VLKRIIPVLLLSDGALVKTQKFADPKYIGDPINAVKIFSEKEADELVFLDISASRAGKEPNYNLVKDIASEAYMPFAYGGGVKSLHHAEAILKQGAEKVIINAALQSHKELPAQLIREFGASSVVACVNAQWINNRYEAYSYLEKRSLGPLSDQLSFCREAGFGEVIIQSFDHDGMMGGYDLRLISEARQQIDCPLVALGGAGKLGHLREALEAGADAASAGSLFSFYGKFRAVLITYPEHEEIQSSLTA
jgi:cyclase